MRKLLQIFLSLQSVMLSWTSIVSCGQKVKTSNKTSPEAKPSSSDKIKLTAAVNKLKNMNLNINVSQLGKLDVLISAIKNDPSYKNIVTEEGIELYKELQLQQEKPTVLITTQNESLIKDHSSFTVNAYLKLNNENMNTSFTVKTSNKAKPSSSDKIKLTAAVNKLENINLKVDVSQLGKLDVLISAIKNDPSYKNIITEEGIELSKELQLQQKGTNVLITTQNQNLIENHSSFIVNAYLKLNNENMNTSFTVETSEKKQENILLEAETKLNESPIWISINEFSNKKVTDKIKESSTFKQNITDKNIELVGDLDFFDEKTNEIIKDWSKFDGSNVIVQGFFKFGTHQQKLKFNIKLLTDGGYIALKKSKSSIETLENSNINLLALQNKSELIKALEAAINNKKTVGEIRSNSIKIYNKSNGIEIADTNQKLIEDGLEIKVTLVLEDSTDALPIEFNCKIVDKNIVDLEAVKIAKDKLENLSQPIEIKIGETFGIELLFNLISKYFKDNNYIENSNVILSDKLEFFDLESQIPIVIDNIEFDTPFIVKTNISLNSTFLPITFKVKLIHATFNLDILATSIKKLQSYNGFKVYMEEDLKLDDGGKSFFWWNVLMTNEFQENLYKMNFIHRLVFNRSHYLSKNKIINKTSGKELEKITWGEKVTLKGTFEIFDGELPFEFDVIVADPNENFGIQFISYGFNQEIKNNAFNYIKNKNCSSLSKRFIIQMFEDIFVSTHKEYISKYGEIEIFNLQFYKYDGKAGKYVITNDIDIKDDEYILIEGKIRMKNNHSIYGSLMDLFNFTTHES